MNLGLKNEDAVQAEIVQWARKQSKLCPQLGFLYHCPNGGHRHPIVAMKMRALGVSKGVPDLFLAVPCGQYAGLYMEVKNGEKGRLSEEQKLWIEGLRKNHYRVEVVKTAEEGIEILKEYIK